MTDTGLPPDDQQEDLSDLAEAGSRYTAVINASDWTAQTIVQQIDKGNIELNPNFQRREAWRIPRKSQYIESLIMEIPVPSIVLAERKDKKGKYIVIDGKQRLLTLRQFYATTSDRKFRSFKLSGLTMREDLNGLGYEELSQDLLYEPDQTALDNSTIRTSVIKNWKDENFLYTIFLRLNTGSVPLSPQELRQALHPGEFVKFVDEYSLDSTHIRRAMRLSEPDVRMRDAELVIRYYAFRNFLDTYTGNLKPLLDSTSKFFNKNWTSELTKINQQKRDLEFAIDTTISIFGEDHAFRKWNGRTYEASFNRAIFDCMVIGFVNQDAGSEAITKRSDVERAFKAICIDNDDFRSSIEGTTKSIQAIFTRLKTWISVLNSILDSKIPTPSLVDNKIFIRGQ